MTFGSGLLGFRSFPLIRIHLSPVWTLDFDALVTVRLHPQTQMAQQYLLGFSATW